MYIMRFAFYIYSTAQKKVKVPRVCFGYGTLLVRFWCAHGPLEVRSWCATGTLLKRSKYAREMRFGSVRCSTVRPLLRLYACVAGARLLSYARDTFFTPSDQTARQ